jgi:flagellar hook protein FlgE
MVGKTGIISGIYTNGMVRDLGQIALASFANPEGLTKASGNLYAVSANSGEPNIGAAGEDSRGTIETSSLEMSNVDLSYEFTEMITTSRAYQANSRVITTSDELLQEVVNLKR